MLDVARQLKERKAGRVFVCTTYGLFTDGVSKFDEYYEKGWLDRVITTTLTIVFLIFLTVHITSKLI